MGGMAMKFGTPLTVVSFLVLFLIVSFFPSALPADTLDNWILSDSGTAYNLYGVTFGNGIFVAVGGNDSVDAIITSDDGATWTWQISYISGPLYGVAYGNGTFVAVGRDYYSGVGAIVTSDDDGVTWTSRTSGTDITLYGVTCNNGRFITVGGGGTILTSDDDGVTWTSRTSGISNTLYGVTHGNGIYVAVGSGGAILTSDDNGVTWRPRISGTSDNLRGVAFGNNMFVAVGLGGTILTSDANGATWTLQTYFTSYMLAGISHSNGTFVAAGSMGTILTSSNGENWMIRSWGTSNILWGVTYGGGVFVIAGSNGTILRANIGSILVNSGATRTNSTSVTLTLSCDDGTGSCAQMQFSNDNITWSAPEAYETTKSWTLASGGDGTRTVYVRFQDNASNWTVAFYDTIILETAPPTVSASPGGGTYYSAKSVTLTCSDGTGSGCYRIYYTTDGSAPTTGSPVYTGPINISANTTLKFFARDNAGNSSSVSTETYTITIYPPLTIGTSSLASGTLGISYSQSLAASGGLPPYSWSLYTGILPNGLSLSSSGVISGTPTAYGTFNFTVRVTDSLASTATRALSITIQTYPVRIADTPPSYFNTIQSSYNSAADSDIIQIQALTFTENLNFNQNISVTLKGGYDYNFTANASNTAVIGTLTISSGTVTIENVSIQ